MLLYVNMKNNKNIACTDLHSYEESYSFVPEFIKKISFAAL